MANVISNYLEDPSGYSTSPVWDNLGETPLGLTSALDYVLGGQSVVYAMRMPDGAIKIGRSVNLANRCYQLHGQILGFLPGGHDEEQQIHRDLRAHRVRGKEYYSATAAVMAVVNEMRQPFGLPQIAA